MIYIYNDIYNDIYIMISVMIYNVIMIYNDI